MSEWRQRGFVQDSDEEEEESQIESQHSEQHAHLQERVERVLEDQKGKGGVADAMTEEQKDSRSIYGSLEAGSRASESTAGDRTPTKRSSPIRPTPSPFTPFTRQMFRHERSESPDPLQSSPKSNRQLQRPAPSSPRIRSSVHQRNSQEEIELRAFALPSQILGETVEAVQANSRNSDVGQGKDSGILSQFGISAFSDDSGDDLNPARDSDAESKLSDYPSDLSDTDVQPAAQFATPHRRTAVRVVIPSSTALQHQLAQEEARRRHFRQRKPIQLHPYVLEGERYRREVQSRGLKPVPRERSPQQRQRQNNQETQEEDFNPFGHCSSSPPDPEIFVSTPVAQHSSKSGQQSSTKRPMTGSARRNSPTLQLRVPKPAKRRRLDGSLAQAVTTPARTFESSPVPIDIWSVPPNSPPYSSSPPLNARVDKLLSKQNIDSLPTPSNSSTFHDETPQLVESDSDPVPRSAQRAGSGLRWPRRTILGDELSSDSDGASGESEQGEGELQKVSKKIRGVLPASWLRIDQQAQERRQVLARQQARLNATQSPEPAEPQRGVAQRVTKAPGRPAGFARPAIDPAGVMVISDDSDTEDVESIVYRQASDIQDSIEEATALAAKFDDRYADSGDDLASMEHDRLQLPTLGGSGAKRKRQPKITDAWGNTKRTKTLMAQPKSSRHSGPRSGPSTHKKHTGRRKARRTPPPALSVLDIELPSVVPQFLRLARRAARRDINQARQSLHRKQIRLHTAQDTEDANAALQQWRQGVLKPKVKPASGRKYEERRPLVDTTDNQQCTPRIPRMSNIEKNPVIDITSDSTPRDHPQPRKRRAVAPALRVLQRSSNPISKQMLPRKVAKTVEPSGNFMQRGPLPHRAAQLEGEEQSFGSSHRKIAFQKGLQRVEQQAANYNAPQQPLLNPQLARFLADDDAVLPPLSTAKDIGEVQIENVGDSSTVATAPAPRERLVRKPHAKRIDVDAREYRQPSEPTFDPVVAVPASTADENVSTEKQVDALHGLGPYGTRYPTTFDITPLRGDTYFQADTFVGSEDLRRALSTGRPDARDLDEAAGYCTISHDSTTIRCGPWNDETYYQICDLATAILLPLNDSINSEVKDGIFFAVLTSLSTILRALSSYFASHLSFLDPIDRSDFMRKMQPLLQTIYDQVATIHLVRSEASPQSEQARVLSYLLVVGIQVQQIAGDLMSNNPDKAKLSDMIKGISQRIMKNIAKSTKYLHGFHEKNKSYKERESGIQEHDICVENFVVSMHALELLNAPSLSVWDVMSQELSSHLTAATQVQIFENVWATIFALLPLAEFDLSGIPDRSRTHYFNRDNWGCLCDLLRRVLGSYLGTSQQQALSANEYIRINLTRCYVLISEWHWKRPDQVLNVIFDFYGRHGLRPLRRETATGSAQFLQNFAVVGSLALAPNDSSFHIALKCLAVGLQGMTGSYLEKKIRSFVFRRIPNHGRTYPKDQPLEEASLAALRNHHDLLSTLYCAAPPSCRPKLERIRDLVSHETSHREACRVSVRAWANLSTFQLSTDESYDSARPLAYWYKDIMHQTLKQYRLAKIEAEDYLTSGVLDGTSEVAKTMVRQTMAKNQEQAIATLRDSIAGMRKTVGCAKDRASLAAFLADSDFVQLLELPHLDDHRLVTLVRDTLAVLRQYVALRRAEQQQQHVSQSRSEESQEYGDFPDLDDLDDTEALQPFQATIVPGASRFEYIQGPLWHLMSNAFGAEGLRDDSLLKDCVDIWVDIASDRVTTGEKRWSYYIESFGQVSWQQLRRTEQTNKFGPYFMAAVITCDPTAYAQHRHEFLTALLLCLVDKESMLRFQHRLLDAIVQTDTNHPMLRNLPFYTVENGGGLDITSETLRSRRLALLSSLLSNMREDLDALAVQEPTRVPEVKRTYAAILKDFMNRLKSNYQQLQQGDAVTGAYVEFVQKIVQFLKQYTGDICPVLPFFTDSVAFPLPSTDPTYVVGRLCGYAPKAKDPGTAKQLSVFIQTVAQQAAADNQQVYLVGQLKRALCTNEAPFADRAALRTVLLQAIFPAYIEVAFLSRPGHLVARPILQCLSAVLGEINYDLRVSQPESLSTAIQSIVSIAHAFIRATEHLKGDISLFQQSNTSDGLLHMFDIAMTTSRILDYIVDRVVGVGRPPLVIYLEEFSIYTEQMLNGTVPDEVPSYRGDAIAASSNAQYADIMAFCQKGLLDSLKTNWSADDVSIWFGQGHTKKQIAYDTGSVESGKTRLLAALHAFQDTIHELVGTEQHYLAPTIGEYIIV
ncbi:uncharacterized protein M421DRAFT_419760 [Didymella exigua CBS 183.55]|uniref:Mus7/MMS22 family-domain-containing protein n=1 Tax=Didymella exigua CBS 183.55 TaxID=1150837 RepID=A0A6A5RLD4_9PLEO|nr:uncharacterized protein M421DRAFT_419760 [Didymella exigua CBS 183.55]KAF1929241.1 hypothetical protein M421DRAFT_419760 [Didymella exigua CBS 183.55]